MLPGNYLIKILALPRDRACITLDKERSSVDTVFLGTLFISFINIKVCQAARERQSGQFFNNSSAFLLAFVTLFSLTAACRTNIYQYNTAVLSLWGSSLVHSHWSRNVKAWLSLVKAYYGTPLRLML